MKWDKSAALVKDRRQCVNVKSMVLEENANEFEIEYCEFYATKEWKGENARCLKCQTYYHPEKLAGAFCVPDNCESSEEDYTEEITSDKTDNVFMKCKKCNDDSF